MKQITSLEHLIFKKKIGQGGFSIVYLAVSIFDSREVAVKMIKKDDAVKNLSYIQNINNEHKILELLQDNPFVTKLISSFQTQDKVVFIMEYHPYFNMFMQLEKATRFYEEECRYILAQLVLALDEIHKRNVIMRDIKLENIMVDSEGYIKLVDYGLSELGTGNDEVTAATQCGTICYQAPEQILHQVYTQQVDIWAVGLVAYELFTGRHPFDGDSENQIAHHIVNLQPSYSEFGDEFKNFIQKCLHKNTEQRFQSVQQIKFHPFFKKTNFQNIYFKKEHQDFLINIGKQIQIDQLSKSQKSVSNKELINNQKIITDKIVKDSTPFEFQFDTAMGQEYLTQSQKIKNQKEILDNQQQNVEFYDIGIDDD